MPRRRAGFQNLTRHINIVILALRMSPADAFHDGSSCVERRITGIRVRLQDTSELGQVLLRMHTFTIRRIAIPHSWRIRVGDRVIIAHIGPQPGSVASFLSESIPLDSSVEREVVEGYDDRL